MKILAVHSALNPDENKQSAVDHWRIYRPLRELAKHTDWQIDHQPVFIKDIEKYKSKEEFTEKEFQKAVEHLGSYDIIFSSYHADPTAFALLQVVRDRYGTKFVMDVDDDMFSINIDNPIWMVLTDEHIYQMQRMIIHNDWITTTNEFLANEFRKRRQEQLGKDPSSVFVLPNHISKDYKHKKFENKKPVIGYFGGSSHYDDLHKSGVLKAIKRLKRRGYDFDFITVGMVVDKILNKQAYKHIDGRRGKGWFELFSELNFDIALGPLNDTQFARGKSNIKWQEATRMGAAFVGSRVGPYAPLPVRVARTVQNTPDAWLKALKELLDDPDKRKQLVKEAQKELQYWELESHWTKYKELFENVQNRSGDSDVQPPQISQKLLRLS